MGDFFYAPEHEGPRITFSDEPVRNAVNSICLLNQDHVSGISHWVDQMSATITAEEREQARLACSLPALLADLDTSSVPALVASLRQTPADALVRSQMAHLVTKARVYGINGIPDVLQLESDEEAFVNLVRRLYTDGEMEFEEEAEREEYRRITSADRGLKMADMLEHFWNTYLEREWPNVAPGIAESVAGLESATLPAGTLEAKLRYITGRENIPQQWLKSLATARHIIYVPSVHIGPYMILFDFDGTTAYIMGPAHVPPGAPVHSAELDRSELLMRLEAVSDSVRLSILAQASLEPVTTAAVMESLQLSQSSASRHLSQLAATGLLIVDASERTKRFTVNTRRVEELCHSLRELTGSSPAN